MVGEMREPALRDRDAIPALQLADVETRERYAEIRSRMRAKEKVTNQERGFIKGIRSQGRDLELERKKVAYERLFTDTEN